MYEIERGPFLSTLSRRPYRFAASVFFVVLNFISGMNTNMFFFAEGMSAFSPHMASALPLSLPPVLGAAAWQVMLTSAAVYGNGGGMRMLPAIGALSAESFVLGFSISELLFHHGEAWIMLLLLLTAINGMAGIMLRIFCFIMPENMKNSLREGRPYASICKSLVIITLMQSILIPYITLAD